MQICTPGLIISGFRRARPARVAAWRVALPAWSVLLDYYSTLTRLLLDPSLCARHRDGFNYLTPTPCPSGRRKNLLISLPGSHPRSRLAQGRKHVSHDVHLDWSFRSSHLVTALRSADRDSEKMTSVVMTDAEKPGPCWPSHRQMLSGLDQDSRHLTLFGIHSSPPS